MGSGRFCGKRAQTRCMTPARETKRAARNHAFTLPYLAAKSQPIFLAVSRDCKKWLDGVAAIRIEDSMTNLFSFGQYLESVGVSPTTGWRWRALKRIETVNIDGRLYVTEDAIRKFEQRAAAGEFSTEHKAPKVTE
jgi:hypothetical protein